MVTKPLEFTLLFCFHISAFVHHCYVVWFGVVKLDPTGLTDQKILTMLNYFLLYFTTWNFTGQVVYFGLALWYDILHILPASEKQKQKVLKLKSYLYSSFIFPSGIFVPLMFWGLYNIEKEYVYPASCEEFFPGWLNHSLHTVVLIVVVIEFLLVQQPPQSLTAALRGYNVIFFSYHIVYIGFRMVYGYWLYPFFNILTEAQAAAFMVFYYLWNIGLIVIGLKISKFKCNAYEKRLKEL